MCKCNVGKDDMKLFASDCLTVISIVYAYLKLIVSRMNILNNHIRCFELLHCLLGEFTCGSSPSTTEFSDRLARLTREHAELFLELYDEKYVKIKFHHAFHLPGDYSRVGRVIGCFATERRHRDVKSIAWHIFSNYENALTLQFVHYICQRLSQLQYAMVYMAKPTRAKHGWVSPAATCRCGEVRRRDFVRNRRSLIDSRRPPIDSRRQCGGILS